MNVVSKGVQILDFLQNDFPYMDVMGISDVIGHVKKDDIKETDKNGKKSILIDVVVEDLEYDTKQYHLGV
ncbi:3-hydroxy-3-methylglutaryl-coenzyme A reductase 2 [Spatholobus suberectus]|nr:3-hydroxy-3-methylglutaryl-coenzyme A reductase 2 [Spatholobus suberectus]